MKPKTKYDHFILEESAKLKPLSDAQIKWMEQHTVWNYATNHYKKTCCLECNHQWNGSFPDTKKTVKCPSCKKILREHGYYTGGANTEGHGVIYDRVGPISVIRIVYVRKHLHKYKVPSFQVVEVARKFYDPIKRKYSIMNVGMNGMMGAYQGGWNLNQEMSLKNALPTDQRTRIGYICDTYPNKRIPKEISRLGFTLKNKTKISHDDFLYGIMTDSRCETLLKYGEHEFLEMAIYNGMSDDLWSALKICFRQYYHIKSKDVQDYADYIRLLTHFGKDVRSPKYACPEDLHIAHQRLVRKRDAQLRKEREERQRLNLIEQTESAKKYAKKYIKRTKRYFDLLFTDRNIVVEVMKSVEEFMHVGDLLKHCIFTNEYYEKTESLILYAKRNGEIIETIEVNLNTMKVTQARGYDNKASKYNTRIVKLVNKNLVQIKKLHKKAA